MEANSETSPEGGLPDETSREREFLRRLGQGAWIGIRRAVIAAVVTAVVCTLILGFLESSVRARASRVRTDMRSLATAIEAYYVDHEVYPPGEPYWGSLPKQLTTPIAYITSFPFDPYTQYAFVRREVDAALRFWLGPIVTGAIGVAMLLVACGIFMCGRSPGRFGVVVAVGYLGLTWAVLSAAAAVSDWKVLGGRVYPSGPNAAFVGGILVVTAAVLGFGSGLGKAMREGGFWRLPPGIDVAIIVLLIVLWIGMLAAGHELAGRIAEKTARYAIRHDPLDLYFRYATDGHRSWLLWSAGPDGERDLAGPHVVHLIETQYGVGLPVLLHPFTYDPTNGTVSRGDIWRIKQ